MSSPVKVDALFAGQPQPLGPRGAPSSIVKSAVSQLTVHLACTDEDQQSNKKLHGGPEKVLHQFSPLHYFTLRKHFPDGEFEPGSIGENISVDGMDDATVYIGDVWKFGEVVLQVSAPRAPCSKISQRFNIQNLDRFVGERGITGWYYRVLETGVINVGDSVTLVSREDDTVNVQTLMRCAHTKTDVELATKLANLAIIDNEWRDKCARISRKG
ncbi:MOSC domain-containing protein [Alteromonas stellipolaris]|uniref:MOSC domain-containing protein n=1 Tax=Alteromonas stellipolaris TaxID=233316 RepID=UPI0026E1B53B|nr:MOSC domain-containing protein [Alteromonas stellipolaris]MDO6533730.1 MOSC domain-containing protein [Alteromonas stellipolaris]MDO6625276.1 MOSC domain-containing protein [Alteromonas stellipolaris]